MLTSQPISSKQVELKPPAPYGGVLYRPSASELERKAATEEGRCVADLLTVVTAEPDVHVDELTTAAPDVPAELLQLALARLLASGAIRETESRLVTAELAAERDADTAAEDAFKRAEGPLDLECSVTSARV